MTELRARERRMWVSSMAYSLSAILLLALSLLASLLPMGEPYSLSYCLLNTAVELLVMGVPLGFCLCFSCMREQKPRWKALFGRPRAAFLLTIPMAVCIYFVVEGITLAWIGFLGLFAPIDTIQGAPAPGTAAELLPSLLVVGLCPALAEEGLFRGALLGGYEGLKPWQAVLLTGTLFGLLHGQIAALPAHVLLGILLCAVVAWSNSLYPAILLHLMQNGLALFMGWASKYILQFYDRMGLMETVEAEQQALLSGGLPQILSGAVTALTFAVPLIGLLILYGYLERGRRPVSPIQEERPSKLNLLPLLPGLAVSAFLYINSLVIFYGWLS